MQEAPDDKVLRRRFTAWYQENAEHRHAWEEANATWNALGELNPMQPLVAEVASVADLHPYQRHMPRIISLAATLILSIVLYYPVKQWFTTDYFTGTGESQKIQLKDGSTIWLGAESAIKVNYQANARTVELLNGEAYFSVHPDSSRPFRVITTMADTTVLGTEFNVNLIANTINVAVDRGRVAVTAHNSSQLLRHSLTAGNWLRLDETGNAEWGNSSAEPAGVWRSGKLFVNNRPVGEVLDEVRRYYHGAIMLTDNSFASHRLTGMYNLQTPEDALQAIAQVQNLQLIQITPWIILLSPS